MAEQQDVGRAPASQSRSLFSPLVVEFLEASQGSVPAFASARAWEAPRYPPRPLWLARLARPAQLMLLGPPGQALEMPGTPPPGQIRRRNSTSFPDLHHLVLWLMAFELQHELHLSAHFPLPVEFLPLPLPQVPRCSRFH